MHLETPLALTKAASSVLIMYFLLGTFSNWDMERFSAQWPWLLMGLSGIHLQTDLKMYF